MIDFFHIAYNNTFKLNNTFFSKIRIGAIFRFLIIHAANIIIPITLKCNNASGKKEDFIVSLTSFPNRISKVHLVIMSILNQSISPKRVILWLSRDQFDSLDSLPKKLLNLRSQGLEIYLKPGDLRSFKKYYYLQEQYPDETFIIVDDDVFYTSKMIENLLKSHKKYPDMICANRCVQIKNNSSYVNWSVISGEALPPRFDILPTGCGGVLYPKNSLHLDAFNKELFLELSYDADDIWLNCMAFLNKTPIVYTGGNEYLLAVKKIKNTHLHKKNVGKLNNDYRIELIKKHYLKELKEDVFDRS